MPIAVENYQHICKLLHDQAGIVLSDDKQYLVETRLYSVAHTAGLSNVDALIAKLRMSPDAATLQSVIDAMTTNETSFFRDTTPFEVLRSTVIPELIERRQLLRTIRIWSAGCSSGQEPYSLAMMWQENFAHLSDWNFKVLATDISTTMLAQAKIGQFTDTEVRRGLDERRRSEFFRQTNNDWQILGSLQAMVEFQQLNLIHDVPPVKFDVIFLRNVLVYFDVPTKQKILERLRSVLAPDGCLFLGGAETTVMIDDAFERVPTEAGSYYRLSHEPERRLLADVS